jgi:hypothetical protein
MVDNDQPVLKSLIAPKKTGLIKSPKDTQDLIPGRWLKILGIRLEQCQRFIELIIYTSSTHFHLEKVFHRLT